MKKQTSTVCRWVGELLYEMESIRIRVNEGKRKPTLYLEDNHNKYTKYNRYNKYNKYRKYNKIHKLQTVKNV